MSKETKKNVEVTEAKEEKVLTKYDRKMQRRKAEEKKEARTRKIFKITSITVLVVALVSLVIATVFNVNRIYKEYIKIDGESISQIEFDMYYSLTKNSIVSQTLYGDMTYLDYFVSYLGYDTTKSDKVQDYSDKNSWFDYFGTSTLATIKEYKALNKLADEHGFEYADADKDYEEFIHELEHEAEHAEKSVGAYYKDLFGKHATKSNTESFVKEYLRAVAYEEHLYEHEKATDDEVKKYYEEHKDDYDCVEYHSVFVRAEEKNDTALAEAKKKADELLKEATSVEALIEGCVDYVAKDDVETYKKEDATLMKDIYKGSLSTTESDWLFNKDRKKDDKTVLEDKTNYQYQVVYFVEREYDKDNDESIRATLYNEYYTELLKPLTEKMEVEDKHNRITVME
ncbi:MAG: peptidyl-prolyl cis-trans isomerase [Lachnospira sp.]|nr:peptidyl-prolyl cis-trans isomerase [Lachnospira sp.]